MMQMRCVFVVTNYCGIDILKCFKMPLADRCVRLHYKHLVEVALRWRHAGNGTEI